MVPPWEVFSGQDPLIYDSDGSVQESERTDAMQGKRTVMGVTGALLLALLGTAIAQSIGIVVYRDNPGQHVPTTAIIGQCSADLGLDAEITTITHANRQTVLTTSLEAGSGPDILILSNYDPYLYASSLLDVSDLAADLGEANGGWYPIAESLGNVNGTWRALPTYIYMHQLLYLRSAFEQAGVTVPDTWEEFRAALQAIKDSDASVQPLGVSFGRSFDGQQFLLGVLLGFGSQVLNGDGEVVFDSPETVAGLQYVVDLYRDGLADPTVVGWDDGTNNQAMLAQRIATTFNGFSVKQQAVSEFPDIADNIGTAIYPRGPVTRASFPTAFSYGIRSSTAYPAEAKELLGCVLSHDNFERVLNETRGAIGTPFQGFADLSVWDDPDFATNLTAIESATLFAPASAETATVENSFVIVDMLADVLVRDMSPQEAVTRAAERMEEIYGSN